MFNWKRLSWTEKNKTTNYNVDSTANIIHHLSRPMFASTPPTVDQPRSPVSWGRVRDQFNCTKEYVSNCDPCDEKLVNSKRQAFIALWTSHAIKRA